MNIVENKFGIFISPLLFPASRLESTNAEPEDRITATDMRTFSRRATQWLLRTDIQTGITSSTAVRVPRELHKATLIPPTHHKYHTNTASTLIKAESHTAISTPTSPET